MTDSNTPPASEHKVRLVDIDQRHHDQRLDNFLLAQLKGVPKSRVYKLLRSGQVRVTRNGKVKRRKVGLGHLCSTKSGSRKRKLRRPAVCPKSEEKRARQMLGC